MVFSSIPFLFVFLPVTLLGYFLIPGRYTGLRNGFLLVMNLIFYGLRRAGVRAVDAALGGGELQARTAAPAGENPPREKGRADCQRGPQPGGAGLLQVYRPGAGDAAAGAGAFVAACGVGAAAHRHQLLHLPGYELRHRRLPGGLPGHPALCGLRGLYLPVPPVDRRPHRPLQRRSGPASDAPMHRLRLFLGRQDVRHRPCQKGAAGQPVRPPVGAGGGGAGGLRYPGRLVRHPGLRPANLLRLRRLFRHGPGPGGHAGLRLHGQLQLSLHRQEHYRVSGGAGTSPSAPGSGIMSTSPWAAAGAARGRWPAI